MKSDEIRELSVADVEVRINELEEERFRLRFRSATEPLEDPLRMRVIRKDIARLRTILAEKQSSAVTKTTPKTVSKTATTTGQRTTRGTAKKPAKSAGR